VLASAEGEGTTVTVWLPGSEPAEAGATGETVRGAERVG